MTGRERWLKEADIPMARLSERFALNGADEIIWRIGPRAGSRAARMGPKGYRAIHSVLDGREYRLRESRVVFALKHGRWPPDGHEVEHKKQDRNLRPPKACGFPGVRKTKSGKFKTSVVANGRDFNFGPFDDPEEAYRIHLAAKAVLDPHDPLRPVKGVRPDTLDRMRTAHRIVRAARRFGDKALELDAWDAFIAAM